MQKRRLHDAIVGLLVTVGIALGHYVSAHWLLLPAAIGLTLVQSGVTGFCPVYFALDRLLLQVGRGPEREHGAGLHEDPAGVDRLAPAVPDGGLGRADGQEREEEGAHAGSVAESGIAQAHEPARLGAPLGVEDHELEGLHARHQPGFRHRAGVRHSQ